MQLDDIRLLRMSRQYLFAPAEDELTVLQSLCGLQAQFYGNCLHALHLRCGKAPDENALLTSAAKTWTLRGTLHLIALDDLPLFLYAGDQSPLYFSKNCRVRACWGWPKTSSGVPSSTTTPPSMNRT